MFPQFYLPVHEHPADGESKHKKSPPSDPRKVLLSEGFESEEVIIDFKIEPGFFHCAVTSVLLVVVFEGLSNFGINDVIFRELVCVGFDIKSGRELSRAVGSIASVLGHVERYVSGQTSFIPSELIDVHFLPDNSVTNLADILTRLIFFGRGSLC